MQGIVFYTHRERVNERQDSGRVFWFEITGNPINSLKSQGKKYKQNGITTQNKRMFYSDKAFCIHF